MGNAQAPSSDPPTTSTDTPKHDTPILGMVKRPRIPVATEFGNAISWWVEYPTGLIDVTRTTHLPKGPLPEGDVAQDQPTREVPIPPLVKEAQLDIPVDGERTVRIATKNSAVVIIDMQK